MNFHEFLNYEPQTGSLTWRRRAREQFRSDRACNAWNARFAGKTAGSVHQNGYRELLIAGSRYQAHRVIWFMSFGCWPIGDIDHINGDKSDNRLSNLRNVSHAENGRNRAMSAHNTSGANGVSKGGKRGKWQARITVGGATRSLGYFDDFADAVAARKAAERQLDFHPNHGRSNERMDPDQRGAVSVPSVQPHPKKEKGTVLTCQ